MTMSRTFLVAMLLIAGSLILLIPSGISAEETEVAPVQSRAVTYTSWNQFMGGAEHTGAVDTTMPMTNDTAWYYEIYDHIWSSPSVVDGRFFVGTNEGTILCLNEYTGEEIWTNTTTNDVQCSPCIVDDLVYIKASGPDKDIQAFNVSTGTEVYTFTTEGSADSSCVSYQDYIIYSTTEQLYLLNKDLTKVWNVTSDNQFATPGVSNDLIYNNEGTDLVCHYLSNGTVKWRSTINDMYGYCTPTIADGRVYVGSGDTGGLDLELYCFNADTGALVWNESVRSTCATPSYYNGKVYIGDDYGGFYCYDGANGNLDWYWEHPMGAFVYSSTAIADGKIIVLTGTGDTAEVLCMDLDGDGAGGGLIYWRLNAPGHFNYNFCSSPAISNGRVFVCADGDDFSQLGGIWCIGAKADLTPPEVQSTSPTDGSTGVSEFTNITITFTEGVNATLVDGTRFMLLNQSGGTVATTVTYDALTNSTKIDPVATLDLGVNYTVKVLGTLLDPAGNGLDGDGDGTAEGSPVDDVSFNFTTRVANAPSIGTIGPITATEDIPYVVDLLPHISDDDTPFENLTIGENSIYADINGSNLTLLYPNGVLSDEFNLTASDGNVEVKQLIQVTVTPVNDAPVLAPIPNQDTTEDVVLSLNTSMYITDIDTDMDDLVLMVNTSAGKVDGIWVNFTFGEGVTQEYVNLSVIDDTYTISTHFIVNVTPVDDPPKLSKINDLLLTKGVEFLTNLQNRITDPDTDMANITITTDSSFVTVNGTQLIFNYPIDHPSNTDTINITVSDGTSSVYQLVGIELVNGTIPNEGPTLSADGVTPTTGDPTTEFVFTVTFRDIDHWDATVVVTCIIDGVEHPMTQGTGNITAGVVFTYTTTLTEGTHTYRFKGDDAMGKTNSIKFTSEKTVVVNATSTDGTDGDGDGGSSNTMLYVAVAVVAVITIIILAVVVVVIAFVAKKMLHTPPEGAVLKEEESLVDEEGEAKGEMDEAPEEEGLEGEEEQELEAEPDEEEVETDTEEEATEPEGEAEEEAELDEEELETEDLEEDEELEELDELEELEPE